MKAIRLTLVLLVTAGVLVGVGAGPAFACSCAMSGVKGYVGGADVIVTGTLTDMKDPPQREVMSSGDPITYTVAVDQTFKGDPASRIEFTSAMSGASCGLEGMQADHRYAFFLNTTGDGLTANLCGGTAPTTQQLEQQIIRWTGPPGALTEGGSAAAAETSATPSTADSSSLGWIAAGAVVVLAGAGVLLWRRRSAT